MISDIEAIKAAQEKKKIVHSALEIIDYIEDVHEQLKNNCAIAFIQNDTKGMYNYLNLDPNRYIRVHGIDSARYVILDKDKIMGKVNNKGIAVIKVSDLDMFNFLFCNLIAVEQKLGIGCLVKKVTK